MFMPIVAGMGGNAATQTLAVIVRAENEAHERTATIDTVNPANEDFSASNARKMPLHIELVTHDGQVLHELKRD